MIKDQYLKDITEIIMRELGRTAGEVFLFGSSIQKDIFGDCDLGVMGEVSEESVRRLKEVFTQSSLPYHIDVVNFNKVSPAFKNNVLNNKVLWIKHSP